MASPRPMCFYLLVMLTVAASVLLAPADADKLTDLRQQLGGYLPPVKDQCQAVVRTTTIQQYLTTTVLQPITIAKTQTQQAQAVATATMVITTTMQRVEQRQMQVPVIRTYEVTGTVTRTQVQQVPFQPPPVTSFFTSTSVRVQTSVQQQFVTQTQTSVRPMLVTQTQFNTQFATSTVVQTRQSTTQIRQRDVEQTVTSTQQALRTQQIPQPAFTSHVQTQIVQTSQAVQFVSQRPETRIQTVHSTVVSTHVQQVFNTQQAIQTREVVRTQVVQVTSTQVQVITSTHVMQQLVVRTSFVDRVVTSTQVIPHVITSTSIFNQINNQFVTHTVTSTFVQTQTVQGLNDIREQIVTSFSNIVQTVSSRRQADEATVIRTITLPCHQQPQQPIITQTGYNYNSPSRPFNF